MDEPELSSHVVAWAFAVRERSFVLEPCVYRILKANGYIISPTTAINLLWQTDFTYLKFAGCGRFFLSTMLDDFWRCIESWKLCTTMRASDVTDTLRLALQASSLDDVTVKKHPRLLSGNRPSYVAKHLGEWLDEQGMTHMRGAPYHLMTQGEIECWYLALNNQKLPESCCLVDVLKCAIVDFVQHYNHRRYPLTGRLCYAALRDTKVSTT